MCVGVCPRVSSWLSARVCVSRANERGSDRYNRRPRRRRRPCSPQVCFFAHTPDELRCPKAENGGASAAAAAAATAAAAAAVAELNAAAADSGAEAVAGQARSSGGTIAGGAAPPRDAAGALASPGAWVPRGSPAVEAAAALQLASPLVQMQPQQRVVFVPFVECPAPADADAGAGVGAGAAATAAAAAAQQQRVYHQQQQPHHQHQQHHQQQRRPQEEQRVFVIQPQGDMRLLPFDLPPPRLPPQRLPGQPPAPLWPQPQPHGDAGASWPSGAASLPASDVLPLSYWESSGAVGFASSLPQYPASWDGVTTAAGGGGGGGAGASGPLSWGPCASPPPTASMLLSPGAADAAAAAAAMLAGAPLLAARGDDGGGAARGSAGGGGFGGGLPAGLALPSPQRAAPRPGEPGYAAAAAWPGSELPYGWPASGAHVRSLWGPF
jgi:hypothetical protein